MIIRPISILIAAASLATAGYASAQPYSGPAGPNELTVTGVAPADIKVRSERVSYADLDLTGAAGARTLMLRIRGAASEVCTPDPFIRDLRDVADHRDCKEEAMSSAVEQLDSPLVSDEYDLKR